MPKPVINDNGSGCIVINLVESSKPYLQVLNIVVFLKLLYITSGVIKHAKAINAFTNSSTNSYKRLVPGFEAPTILAYSARNRSASIRIPYAEGEKQRELK